MSGLSEIIEWVQQEIILTRDSEPNDEFESISAIFEKDNRLPLADILGDESPKFLEYLENNIPRSPELPQIDAEIAGGESLLGTIKSFINRLFR